jgi:hypothetical protein
VRAVLARRVVDGADTVSALDEGIAGAAARDGVAPDAPVGAPARAGAMPHTSQYPSTIVPVHPGRVQFI